jgi:hypothetical protein
VQAQWNTILYKLKHDGEDFTAVLVCNDSNRIENITIEINPAPAKALTKEKVEHIKSMHKWMPLEDQRCINALLNSNNQNNSTSSASQT